MASYKTDRAASEIQKEISELIRELKDPRISGMLSVSRVDVTSDLSYCTAYITSLEGIEQTKEAIKGLESATGFIKRELGKRLKIRQIPELVFMADDGIEYSANLAKKMKDISPENGEA